MPRTAPYLLAWSNTHQSYTLSGRAKNEMLDILPESRAWFVWLDEAPSFTFQGRAGSYIARKEATRPGQGYWYAYIRTGKKLLKKYVGKTADLTLARLEDVAGVLHADRATAASTLEHEPVLPHTHADGSRVDTPLAPTPHAPSNTHTDQSNPLLVTKLHMPRPRAQLVSRSHLTERLQEGVAGALTLLSAAGSPALAAPSPAGSLLEPLTERELDILRLLVTGLSNAAMARELVITVGTVKSHVNHIYGKLGVNSRSQAIARAHTLHLL
jgi:LuxR family maltose regulon positive regulatory protein